MPKNGLRQCPEPLPPFVKDRMEKENLKMGEGYYARAQLAQIKIERESLRNLGFFVPPMTVGFEPQANFEMATAPERPKSPGK